MTEEEKQQAVDKSRLTPLDIIDGWTVALDLAVQDGYIDRKNAIVVTAIAGMAAKKIRDAREAKQNG